MKSTLAALVVAGTTLAVPEVYRGLWLKVSPQLRTSDTGGASDLRRLALVADLLPRTHWNVNVVCYRDRAFGATTSTLLTQLHLY